MTFKDTHPSMENIMNFAALSNDTLNKDSFREYFAMAMHFSKCETCRKIKDEMVAFSNGIDEFVAGGRTDNSLKLKVYYSFAKLDVDNEWKKKNIFVAMKGKISKKDNQSVIQSINNSTNIDNIESEYDEYQNEIRFDGKSRVLLGNEKIKIDLYDDTQTRHSMLLIPENAESQPVFCEMEKSDSFWTASCECPEDNYDIVLF